MKLFHVSWLIESQGFNFQIRQAIQINSTSLTKNKLRIKVWPCIGISEDWFLTKMTRFGKFVNLIVKIRRNEARQIFLQLTVMKFLRSVDFCSLWWLKKVTWCWQLNENETAEGSWHLISLSWFYYEFDGFQVYEKVNESCWVIVYPNNSPFPVNFKNFAQFFGLSCLMFTVYCLL